ncbi:MAG: hypothetical protein ABI162_05270 [Luteolibacter sp.]
MKKLSTRATSSASFVAATQAEERCRFTAKAATSAPIRDMLSNAQKIFDRIFMGRDPVTVDWEIS